MAKRGLDKEFKDNLKKQGPFKYSEENWNAAAKMLDEQLPISKLNGFFNRFSYILSVLILLLISINISLFRGKETMKSPEGKEGFNMPYVGGQSITNIKNEPYLNEAEKNASAKNENLNTARKAHKQGLNVEDDEPFRNPTNSIAFKINKSIPALADEITTPTTQYILEENIGYTENAENNNENAVNQNTLKNQNEIIEPIAFNDSENSDKALEPKQDAKTVANEDADTEHNEGQNDGLNKSLEKEETLPLASQKPRSINRYFKIGFEAGLFSTQRTLSSTDIDCAEYITKRNTQESMKPAYSFGLNFGQQIENFNWQIGLTYSGYEEEILYNDQVKKPEVLDIGFWNQFTSTDTTVISKWVIDSIFAGHWNFDTSYVPIQDSVYMEQWDTVISFQADSTIQNKNGVHQLSYFEIPLFVGYTFGKNKWHLDVQPGISIGFLSGSKGSRYVSKDLSRIVSQAKNLEQFNKIIWKAHFRIGVRYAFEQWDFGVYPHYSYTLNNVLNSEKVDQRYGNFGVSIGAYYKF